MSGKKGSGMKVDRLFLEKGCPDCASIRTELDYNSIYDEDFTGSSGQKVMVVVGLTTLSTEDVLLSYGLSAYPPPVLQTHDKRVLIDRGEILDYITAQGYRKKV